jgi:hypothetical protein
MMHRSVITILAAFGAVSGSFAAPANVVADSAATVATHEVLVHSFTGVENPDAYAPSHGISPEVLAYLGGEATKEAKDAGFTLGTGGKNPDAYASSLTISPEARGGATKEGFTPGTGVENTDAYASSLTISPEARRYLGGETAAAVAAGQ